MNWLDKYLYLKRSPGEQPSQDELLKLRFMAFLITGLCISVGLMIFKEIFRSDLASPVAETATVLMFAAALFFASRNNMQTATGMVFLIPALIYAYYLSGFSNSSPPSETIYASCIWLISGILVLAAFSPVSRLSIVFYLTGILTLSYHAHEAGLIPQYLSVNQMYAENPFLILTFVFVTAFLIRRSFDRRLQSEISGRQELELQFKTAFDEARHAMAYISVLRDDDGNITRLVIEKVNRAFESEFRIRLQETLDQEVNYLFSLIFGNDTDWNDLFILNPKQQTELYAVNRDKWYNLHLTWTGKHRCTCLFYDVTREKNMINDLTDARARYRALLEAIPDIFFVIDRDGVYRDVVFKGQEKLYPETREVIGSNIFKVGFSEKMAQKIYSCILKAIDRDTIETIEYTLETAKSPLFFEMRLVRLDMNSVISIARDITRRKKAEFELELAKNKAEDAAALKARFLANLSHDIRTPMNAIVGLTKLLSDPGLTENERDEFIRDVQIQSNTLLSMIENTILLSKIETNTLEVRNSFTQINKLLRELFSHFNEMVPSDGSVRLVMNCGIVNGETGFETDPTLLREILFRLIDNGLKFTRKGEVIFGYSPASGNCVEFFVEDTGSGIPESERDNIFLRFYVTETDKQTHKSGSGLGLPIAQHLAVLLGGELMLDTKPGKGSRFWFRIPLKSARGFMQVVQ
ncbi:MAG: Signal transduction histidine-protein kinase BarA [Bacteroidetes bacterium ADurb.Bin123]|nr:MAG: Signal transduction histidine-protein kinase BarA [Bacteroidetes bacterium ADurb.Bin123]